jgi:hypothetical protein
VLDNIAIYHFERNRILEDIGVSRRIIVTVFDDHAHDCDLELAR